MDRPRSRPAATPGSRPALWEVLVLIAGTALGFWMIGLNQKPGDDAPGAWFGSLLWFLGGLSLVGPPLLLVEARRGRARWGAGRLLWFASGTSAWLLWPPIVARKVSGQPPAVASEAGICFAYGTPLMALYVTLALLAGGWLRRGRRNRRSRSWRERFGLLLGLIWACTGLYMLVAIYRNEFRK